MASRISLIPGFALLLLAGVGVHAQERPLPGGGPAGGPGGADLFERADANHDGYVTRDEMLAVRAAQFTRMDRNHDGQFDAQDFPERAKERPRAVERLNAMIRQLDTDKDGKLFAQEFTQGPTPLFDKADTDANGSLDKAEIAAVREQARARIKALRERGGARRPEAPPAR